MSYKSRRKCSPCRRDLKAERARKAQHDSKQFDLSGTDEKGEENKRYFNLVGSIYEIKIKDSLTFELRKV
jgi:hypothetical protein